MTDIDTRAETGDQPGAVTWLRHNRIDLALHQIRSGVRTGPGTQANPGTKDGGHALLLLHGLGERTPDAMPKGLTWPGPIHGLDFTGHGLSTVPTGGGYTSEVLVGDVDAALDHIGSATILGRGLGAYVALLVAAARPEKVLGAILSDGPGIAGGGVQPGSPSLAFPPDWAQDVPDPFALLELSRDVRPPDYAQNLLGLASDNSELERVFYITAVARPEWLDAIANQPGVHSGGIEEALTYFAHPGV